MEVYSDCTKRVKWDALDALIPLLPNLRDLIIDIDFEAKYEDHEKFMRHSGTRMHRVARVEKLKFKYWEDEVKWVRTYEELRPGIHV